VTFLSPLAAVVAGAVALPLLLALYFLKLRRRPVRVSSTLLWQQATHDLQVNVPFRWIRPSLMLLLHLAALALLLLAMARPAMRMDAAPAQRVVLLVDRSASMTARDGAAGASRLDEARQRALRILENLSRAGRAPAVSVIAFAADARALTTFTQDRGAARAAVNSVEPSDQPGNLAAALQLAGAVLAGDSAGEDQDVERGLVVLFSDGGFAGGNGYSLAGAEFRYERVGGADRAPTADPTPGPEQQGRENVGIVAVAARREWSDPGVVRVFARVQNARAREVVAPVVLRLDDREVQRRALVIPHAMEDGPGQASVTFELSTRESGIVTLSLETDDLLPADNSAGIVLSAATKPRVLVVVPDAAIDAGDRDPSWTITTVLEEMELPYRRISASAFELDAAGGADLRAELVVFDRVRPRSLPEVPSLSFGAGIPADGIETPPAAGASTYFLSWQRTHPVMRDVSLDSVYISRPTPLRVDESRWTVLARGRQGPLIAIGESGGARRLVVGFELASSNWPLHFGFPIFIASCIDALTLRGDDRAGAFFTTAEPVRLDLPAGTRVTLDGPREIAVETPPESPGTTSLGVFDKAGIYRVRGEFRGVPPAVAVNLLDETESALAVADSLRVAGQSVAGIAGEAGPREVWHWFVLAALALLMAEWLVSGWMMRA
jgi:hypothetical protein